MRFSAKQLWPSGTLVVSVLLCALTSTARAGSIYGFTALTANDLGNVATGEHQLFVDVSDASSATAGRIEFRFFNTGPTPSSISSIRFDGSSVLGAPDTSMLAGFQQPVTDASTGATLWQSVSRNDIMPMPPDTVGPSGSTTMTFKLLEGRTFADAIAALEQGAAGANVDSGGTQTMSLRITLGASFGNGGSETFVNNGGADAAAAPTPAVATAGFALLGCRALRRRRQLPVP